MEKTLLKNPIQMLLLGAVSVFLATVAAPSWAVQPTNGFFYGVEMEPVGTASITTVEAEPAVALVFATDQKTADITRQFEEWYISAGRPDINVFAIGVDQANLSRDVILEAINQRKLSMPVFLANSDMLLGDEFRLLILNDDQEVKRLTSFNVSELHAGISELGIPIPAAPIAPAATPAPPVAVTPGIAAPPVAPAPSGAVEILGGKSRDNFYRNDAYGFTVEFPPLWQYQVAARADGAVAVEPRGSKMDMRVWSVPAEDVATPQIYVDQRLGTLAQKFGTRVNVERTFMVREDNLEGVDVTYAYTLPLDPQVPARGGLLHRGRMQVYLDGGYIKAAGVEAPSGEFKASFPLIESFFTSFQIHTGDNPASNRYNSPIL